MKQGHGAPSVLDNHIGTGRLTIFHFPVLAKPLGPWKINSIEGMPSMFIRLCLFHVNNFNLKAHFASHCIPTKYWVFLLHFRESWKHCLYIQVALRFFFQKRHQCLCALLQIPFEIPCEKSGSSILCVKTCVIYWKITLYQTKATSECNFKILWTFFVRYVQHLASMLFGSLQITFWYSL